jgi:hypothetical protein
MLDNASALPEDIDGLRELVVRLQAAARERSAERDPAYEALKLKTLEVEKLKMQLLRLRRMQFGQSSEKLAQAAAQLELAIEKLEASETAAPAEPAEATDSDGEEAVGEAGETASSEDKQKPARRRLPGHLPRETVVHAPAAASPHCGGANRLLGEDKRPCECRRTCAGHAPSRRPRGPCRTGTAHRSPHSRRPAGYRGSRQDGSVDGPPCGRGCSSRTPPAAPHLPRAGRRAHRPRGAQSPSCRCLAPRPAPSCRRRGSCWRQAHAWRSLRRAASAKAVRPTQPVSVERDNATPSRT